MNYQIINDIDGNVGCIKKTVGTTVFMIPLNEEHRLYQEYLEWLSEGNEPLPADKPPAEELTSEH